MALATVACCSPIEARYSTEIACHLSYQITHSPFGSTWLGLLQCAVPLSRTYTTLETICALLSADSARLQHCSGYCGALLPDRNMDVHRDDMLALCSSTLHSMRACSILLCCATLRLTNPIITEMVGLLPRSTSWDTCFSRFMETFIAALATPKWSPRFSRTSLWSICLLMLLSSLV